MCSSNAASGSDPRDPSQPRLPRRIWLQYPDGVIVGGEVRLAEQAMTPLPPCAPLGTQPGRGIS